MQTPFKPIDFLSRDIRVDRRGDGTILLQSNHELKPYEKHVPAFLAKWAREAPDRVWLAQRRGPEREWLKVTYAEAKRQVDAVTQALIDRGFGPDKPVMILSSNSIEFALLTMAAMQARAPLAPVSPAYSVMSQDHAKLRYVFDLVKPGLVFVQNGEIYARALAALDLEGVLLVHVDKAPPQMQSLPWSELVATRPTDAVARSIEQIDAKTVGKFLFTSGSTGMPKAVINTQEMMCANLAHEPDGAHPQGLRSAGRHARLAAVEPHDGRQRHLPGQSRRGRHDLHRRRQAAARPVRGDAAQSARDLADLLCQRAGGLRHAGDGAGEGRRARPAFLQEPQFAGLWRRHPAVRSLRAHGSAGGEAHRLPIAVRHRLGLDRDRPDRDHGALGLRARRPDRPAVPRRAAQARADGRGGSLRAAPQERDRHAGLLPPARPHGPDVRRGGLLQDRRRRPLRRSERSELGPDLRRPRRRGFQADERHLRAGRHACAPRRLPRPRRCCRTP